MDSTYGDLNRTDFIDGKIVSTEIKNHKEQVVNVIKVSKEYKEKIKYFVEEANKYGYDGQELQRVIEEVFGKENVSRYDTSNNKFIRVSKLDRNINGINENDRYSNGKTIKRENINTNKGLDNSSFL